MGFSVNRLADHNEKQREALAAQDELIAMAEQRFGDGAPWPRKRYRLFSPQAAVSRLVNLKNAKKLQAKYGGNIQETIPAFEVMKKQWKKKAPNKGIEEWLEADRLLAAAARKKRRKAAEINCAELGCALFRDQTGDGEHCAAHRKEK